MKLDEIIQKQRQGITKGIRKVLAKSPMSEAELADYFNCPPKVIREVISALQKSGANLSKVAGDRYLLHNVVERGGRVILSPQDRGDGWLVFGIISDNHKGSRHHRSDVEKVAYDTFASEGITSVINAGNWIDGEARFNKSELLVFGMDNQIDYWIDTTPQKKDIITHFISGDDHEGWYAQRECINIGAYAEMKAQRSGRKDLHYLGHVEADIELKTKAGSAVMRVMHPGGGSSYAFSYAPQKIVESFQGGEKPQVLIIGHYHKSEYCYPREVHVISAGTVQDQSMFMRKNKIAAHVGFWVVKIKQSKSDGTITAVEVRWNPFFDRGYYEKRF